MSESSHARSMRALREVGWQTGPLHYAGADGKSHDLWNVADWIACKPGHPLTLGQSCMKSDKAAHVGAITRSEKAKYWVACGGGFLLHVWHKGGGPNRVRWGVETVTFDLDDFEEEF